MVPHLLLTGLILNLVGIAILAIADVWFSRAVLVHLDALEANLTNLIGILRNGSGHLVDSGIDLRRDRGQDRARFVKLIGWVLLALGILTQGASLVVCLTPAT